METPQIRIATIEDLDDVLALSQKLFEYETAFGDTFNGAWTYSEAGRNYFTMRLNGERGFCIVAQIDGKTIGYATVFITEFAFRRAEVNPIGEIENMIIEEAYRGKNVGQLMVTYIKEELKRRGVKRLAVVFLSKNTKASEFYHKVGFDTFSTRLELDL
jgi:GNAT superfamily N-acetyltransferase